MSQSGETAGIIGVLISGVTTDKAVLDFKTMSGKWQWTFRRLEALPIANSIVLRRETTYKAKLETSLIELLL